MQAMKRALFNIIVLGGATVSLGLLACGDEESDQASAPTSTPAAETQQATPTPLPTRAVTFAEACQKSDEKQFAAPPPMIIDPALSYTAIIKTEKGDLTIELFPDVAPVTVNSFVFLACKGYYDGVTFHRVITDFVAQTGDPTGTGSGGPGYFIPDEISSRAFEKGTVGMANRGANTNGSQFFICCEPQPKLNGSYTVFGQLTAGTDVLESITPRNPAEDPQAPPGDKVLEIVIEEK
jgi:cyclophilin family peptidyl-prolyl cis-trans isomerase